MNGLLASNRSLLFLSCLEDDSVLFKYSFFSHCLLKASLLAGDTLAIRGLVDHLVLLRYFNVLAQRPKVIVKIGQEIETEFNSEAQLQLVVLERLLVEVEDVGSLLQCQHDLDHGAILLLAHRTVA